MLHGTNHHAGMPLAPGHPIPLRGSDPETSRTLECLVPSCELELQTAPASSPARCSGVGAAVTPAVTTCTQAGAVSPKWAVSHP